MVYDKLPIFLRRPLQPPPSRGTGTGAQPRPARGQRRAWPWRLHPRPSSPGGRRPLPHRAEPSSDPPPHPGIPTSRKTTTQPPPVLPPPGRARPSSWTFPHGGSDGERRSAHPWPPTPAVPLPGWSKCGFAFAAAVKQLRSWGCRGGCLLQKPAASSRPLCRAWLAAPGVQTALITQLPRAKAPMALKKGELYLHYFFFQFFTFGGLKPRTKNTPQKW